MADLIDRQAVLDCIYACFEEVNYGENAEAINLLGYAAQYVKQMPTETKRGEWVDDAVALYNTADNIVTRIVATRLSHALVDPYLGMEIDKFVVNVQQFLSYLIDDFGADMRGESE